MCGIAREERVSQHPVGETRKDMGARTKLHLTEESPATGFCVQAEEIQQHIANSYQETGEGNGETKLVAWLFPNSPSFLPFLF